MLANELFEGEQLTRTREILRRFQAPRYTTTGRDAIADPKEGMMIFNTTTDVLNYYSNGGWTIIQSNNGSSPYCRAYLDDDQSIDSSSETKIAFDSTTYDIDSDFDSANNRYIPSNAGVYLVILTCNLLNLPSADAYLDVIIKKNGDVFSRIRTAVSAYSATPDPGACISDIVYMDGASDYIEGYVLHNSGDTESISGDENETYLSAIKIL